MESRRFNEWESLGEVYSEQQIEAILNELGLELKGGTEQVFLVSCPFHYNPGSPAFAVNRVTGTYICFNPSCNVRGNLTGLIEAVGDKTHLEAKKLVKRFESEIDYEALIRKEIEPPVFEPFPQDLLDRLRDSFENSAGQTYMEGRGFSLETLRHFEIGYSIKRDCIIVPMHNDQGVPIGFVARSRKGKFFQNSTGLKKSWSAWNIHRAKRAGAVCIIVESAFDAMRIHQAGYPNVVALLGGSLNQHVIQQLERYFTTIVIMTDNDELHYPKPGEPCPKARCKQLGECEGHNPGRDFGLQIEEKVRRKILWAAQGVEVYPHGAKDAGDMTDEEIRHVLSNAIGGMEYHALDEERYEYERSQKVV